MRILLVIFVLFLFPEGFQKPLADWQLLWKAPAKGTQLYADNLGNPFVVNADELIKYRDNGTVFRIYSNKTLGAITSVDVSNPLKIIVFYKDFSRIVMLDNTVTENGSPIFLDERDLEQTSLVCTSYDNGFWVFEPVHFRLIRFNQSLQETARVQNLNQLIDGELQPVYMLEQENRLYMSDPSRGLLQFDIFGTYIKTIPIKGIRKFQVIGDLLFYSDQLGLLKVYGLKTLRENQIELPLKNYTDWQIDKERLFLLVNDSIAAYRIPRQ
jgi:hypothetical protein